MNIDNNDMPEPTEEYPSHMVEETADEEEITDHQAVADILTNGELYEGLTEQRLRDVIEEVLEEADQAESTEPHPTQVLMDGLEANEEVVREEQEAQPHTVQDVRDLVTVDLANLPIGVTAEQYITHYQTTGVLLTEATAVDTAYTGPSTSDSTTAEVPARDPLDELFVNKEEKHEKKPPEEPKPLTAEEIAEIRADRKIKHRACLQIKREFRVRELKITKDDLVIGFSYNDGTSFYHIDIEGEHEIIEMFTPYGARRRRGSRHNINARMSNHFYLDKHMNRLIPEADGTTVDGKKVQTVRGKRVYNTQLTMGDRVGDASERKFLVIDKNLFFNSKGREIKIKRREGVNYNRVMEAKRYFVQSFEEVDKFLVWLRTHVGDMLLAEDFDVMYSMSGRMYEPNYYSIIMRFKGVTISNSFELEHYLGEILVKSAGAHYDDSDRMRSSLHGSISGMRLGFTPADAAMKYQHSHLTSTMQNFGGFCTGDQNYSHGNGNMSVEDLQSHIIRMSQFVTWESLEGGPHMKMENINIHGRDVKILPIAKKERQVKDVYVERMIHEIDKTEEKFSAFSDCFVIVNNNGSLRFVVDYNLFYEKVMEIIGSDDVRRIHGELKEKLYTYNTMTKTFHQLNDPALTDPKKLVKKAYENMKAMNPVYMNGKYLKPHLTSVGPDVTVQYCPEPNFMKELASMILYKLTNKLEEYGNSSEG